MELPLIQMLCYHPGWVEQIGFLDLSLFEHEEESIFVLWLVVLLDRADEVKRLMSLNACCPDRPYGTYFLDCEADPGLGS